MSENNLLEYKILFQNLNLDEALHLSTSHLDGVRLREEWMFWNSLEAIIQRVGELLDEEPEDETSNIELHKSFFELGKMMGSGLRKYRPRLNQCECHQFANLE